MSEKFRGVVLPAERHLESLRKDVEKYKENVNKCNVSMIDSLSFDIGSEVDFIKFVVELTGDQRKQFGNLEDEYKVHSNKVRQCQCVRKLER